MKRIRKKTKDERSLVGFGPVHDGGDAQYHGDPEKKEFTCYTQFPRMGDTQLQVMYFSWKTCCFDSPDGYCGNYDWVKSPKTGMKVYKCLGHGKPKPGEEVYPEESLMLEDDRVIKGSRPDAVGPPQRVLGAQRLEDPEPSKPKSLDYWEPVVLQNAWVRRHDSPRADKYAPGESPVWGPKNVALDEQRVTFMNFEDGASDVRVEYWCGPKAERAVIRERMAQKWKGETWFFLKDHFPSRLPRARYRRGFRDRFQFVGVPDSENLMELVKQAKFGDVCLLEEVGALGIERYRLAAAQRACPDLGEVMIVLIGQQTDSSSDQIKIALRDFRSDRPGHGDVRSIDGVFSYAEGFALEKGLVFKREFDPVDREYQYRACAFLRESVSAWSLQAKPRCVKSVSGSKF